MKIGILTGTRPDIIKMAPLYWEAKKRGHDAVLIHTGQHYSSHLFAGAYASMGLPSPNHALEAGECGSPAESVGKMMLAMDHLLRKEELHLDMLLVHGDTLTALAGSLAAYLNLIPVGHVEAGLRTNCKEPYPEQLDSRAADAASDLHFAPTGLNLENLLREGYSKARIFVTGNTSVDAAMWASKKPNAKSLSFFASHGIDFSLPTIYFSIHRRETTMSRERFLAAAQAAFSLADNGNCVVWSIRPGTKAAIEEFGLAAQMQTHPNLHPIEEIPDYPHIIHLMQKCAFVCTDSGSMQEEAAALHVPCISVRYVTDRPESVQCGANVLAPPKSSQSILDAVEFVRKNGAKMRSAKNPFGNGNAASLIFDAIEKSGKKALFEHQKN